MADTIPSGLLKEAARIINMLPCIDEPTFLRKAESLYAGLIKATVPRSRLLYLTITVRGASIDFGSFTLYSEDLSKILKNCKRCILMAATIGSGADRLIARAQREDMADAVLLDALASAMVEHYCDKCEDDAAQRLAAGEYLTMRFSPGYGDLCFDASLDILNALNAMKEIGLSMTKSLMLVPIKSITAFIGISDRKESRGKSCDTCTIMMSCGYKKRGEFCGI